MSSLTASPSRSDPGADALSSNAANILSEQVQLLTTARFLLKPQQHRRMGRKPG